MVVASRGADGLWSHLIGSVLPDAAWETILYLSGVGVVTLAIGAGTAWLVACHEFPGRRLLGWALPACWLPTR